jgi:Flp pilus assembly pilin Flp
MALTREMAALKGSNVKTDEFGQTLVEYSLIIALIAVAALVGISVVAGGVNSLWNWIGGEVTNAVTNVLT